MGGGGDTWVRVPGHVRLKELLTLRGLEILVIRFGLNAILSPPRRLSCIIKTCSEWSLVNWFRSHSLVNWFHSGSASSSNRLIKSGLDGQNFCEVRVKCCFFLGPCKRDIRVLPEYAEDVGDRVRFGGFTLPKGLNQSLKLLEDLCKPILWDRVGTSRFFHTGRTRSGRQGRGESTGIIGPREALQGCESGSAGSSVDTKRFFMTHY